MIADDLLDLQDTRPFVPFEVHLADGKTITIEHPKWMMVTPDRTSLVYVFAEGPFHRVAIHQITRIVEKAQDTVTQAERKA